MGSGAGIAVVGMAGRFPGARTVDEFWRNLRAGVESIRRFSVEELRAVGVSAETIADPSYVRASGFLADIDKFDAGFFGISPRDASVFDPQHRFFLEVAWEAFEDAGHVPDQIPGAVAVFAAQGMASYLMFNLLRNPSVMETVGEWLVRHTGNDSNFLATRASYELGLRGPSVSVQTACSSSLVAVHLACQALLAGECDVALAGGSTIDPRQDRGYFFREGEILSPDGHCRPFDAAAQGTLFCSATGAVVLKRLEDAERDGDAIRAVLLGSAINNDGADKVGYLAPGVDGQVRVISEALSIAGVSPAEVSFIEAHGTGTLLGDPIELAALEQVFAPSGAKRCVLGSVKSNFGHAGESASVVALIKTVLALQHRELPPTLHFQRPNPRARLDGKPFLVSNVLLPWDAEGVRRAGVTGLGAGGTNAHVVLEEAPLLAPAPQPARAQQLLVLSARSASAAESAAARLAERLDGDPALPLADVAWTLQAGRKAFRHRRAVVASSSADAAAALRTKARVLGAESRDGAAVAFLYPGGGAQYPGMGSGLYKSEPVYRAAIDECLASAAVPGLRDALFPPAGSEAPALEAASLALPALFATEVALTRLFASFGIVPAAVIGHSAGEYAAACAAGVLEVHDAMALVALRGRLFETLPPGGMLVVPLAEAELLPLLPAGLSIGAVNAPASCVVSGPPPELAALEASLRERGVESSRVHINVAAHSAMVEPILPAFEAQCRRTRFRPPTLPYVSNITGALVRPEEVTDPSYWVRHLRSPVRFADGLRALSREPGRLLLEVGPGRTLSSLARQGGTGEAEQSLRHPKDPVDDVAALLASVGRLWCRGAEVAWERLQGAPRRRVPLPTYPFESKRHWVDPVAEVSAAASLKKRPSVDAWFAAPSWQAAGPPQREAGAVSTAARAGPWLLIDSGDPLGDAVARELRGALVVRAQPGPRFQRQGDGYRLRPGSREDLEALFADLRARSLEPQRILHLLGAVRPSKAPRQQAFARAQELYQGLVFLGQQLAGGAGPVRLVVATSGACALAAERTWAPERALLLGPARVISRELPQVAAIAVDVDGPPAKGPALDRLARLLVEEGLGAERSQVFALRGGQRFVQAVAPLRLPPAARPAPWAKDGSRVLITGGLGGLGLLLAAHLARSAKVKLVLLGRSPPGAAQRAQVQALEALGAEVLVLQADTGDRASLASALGAARKRFGGLDVVVHAAGTLRDLPIAARGDDPGRAVIAGKALGALLLEELLADDPPGLLVLFSSVSALLGLPGQIDYTAANAWLDALAHARTGGPTRVVSVAWNAWQEVGLAVSALQQRDAPVAPAAPALEGVAHPVLGHRRPRPGEGHTLPLSRETHWVVGEHVVRGGEAVMPGTGILELFAAAVGPPPSGKAVELRDVTFAAPLVVPAGATTLAEIDLRDGELLLHDGDSAAPFASARGALIDLPSARHHDLAALRARCNLRFLGRDGRLEQPFMDFGPRWSCLTRVGLGQGEALVELELPAAFAGDLADHPLHPALLDLATGSAQALAPGFSQERDFFVPLSYARLVLRAPLTTRLFSHLKLRPRDRDAELVFDAFLFDEQGRELAFAEGYTLRRVGEEGLSRGGKGRKQLQARKPTAQELALREGILPAEGMEALDRVLASGAGPHLIASSVDVAAWGRATDEAAAPRKPTALGSGAGETTRPSAWRAPRSEAEKEMAALWSELLGIDRPGLDDNFFDHGGESLVAVRLSVRLRRKFGVELPIASLFEAPTLAEAAAVIDRARGVEPAAGGAASGELLAASTARNGSGGATAALPAFKHLVCIERGAGLLPFFCVHGAGGNVLNFRELARGLPRAQPFWGLAASGIDGRARPAETVEEAAAAYLAEVRTLQPAGPYLLGGYSGGGVIAYEMAQRLVTAGEKVSLLAFIDTYSPLLKMKPVDLVRRLERVRSERLDYFAAYFRRRAEDRERRRTLDQVDTILARGGEIPPELREPHLFRAFSRAIVRYQAQPYRGSATLFRIPTNWFVEERDDYEWGNLMPGRVRVVQIPGNHQDLLVEPNASVLIRELHLTIERAQGVE